MSVRVVPLAVPRVTRRASTSWPGAARHTTRGDASAGSLTSLNRPTTILIVGKKRPRRKPTPPRNGVATTRVDQLQIASGRLGPVGVCKLDVRPLTVFIGKQGTGKSLIAQVLYALEELPFLAQYVAAQKKWKERLGGEEIFARVLDRLRSAERRFARFASGKTEIAWTRGHPWEMPVRDSKFEFTMYPDATRTRPNSRYQKLVEAFASPGLRPTRHAVFVPTERMVVSQLRTALAERVLALPITYELFADWLESAHSVQGDVRGREIRLIDKLSHDALTGSVRRVGEQWKWRFPAAGPRRKKTEKTIDLDLASSGQRANWSIGYLARAFYGLRDLSGYARHLTMFVEEPELHLHPAAQVAMVQILATLANSGFRVVLTTHSLASIYMINNLLLAKKQLGDASHEGAPDPLSRLGVDDVAVYAIRDGTPVDIVNRNEAFIDEHDLGNVGAELGEQMNFLLNVEV